jgi:hypothetical protein
MHGRRNSLAGRTGGGVSRRHFLHRAGLTGAAAAALVGVTEMSGLSSAFAARTPRACNGCLESCQPAPGNCGGRCGPDTCCFNCVPGGGPLCSGVQGGFFCLAVACKNATPRTRCVA